MLNSSLLHHHPHPLCACMLCGGLGKAYQGMVNMTLYLLPVLELTTLSWESVYMRIKQNTLKSRSFKNGAWSPEDWPVFWDHIAYNWLSWWFSGKESTCNAVASGLIPGSGRSSGEGNRNPLQYSCLGNYMDTGVWQTAVHVVARVGHNLATKANQRSL